MCKFIFKNAYLLKFSPEGAYAVITKHGRFDHIKQSGGLVFCLPWTKI
jgi:metal-dependent hydrolase (beta-lactamase superfamily II)